jgi:hypothetical protein
MIRINYLSLLLISLLIISCNSDENPTNSVISPEDLAIHQKLIGGWEFAGNYIYFKDDGTYSDSNFINPYPIDPGGSTKNICSDVKKEGLYLNRITEGRFKVENGLLKKQPLKYTLDCNPIKNSGCYLYFDAKIEISNDTLKLTNEFVWTKNGDNNGIYGSWKRNYWAWSYHATLPPNGSQQLITESIHFFPDSSVYHQKMEGLPYNGSIARRTFNYNQAMLNGTDDNTFYIVSFNNDKMHWTNQNRSTNYLRIK